VRRLPGRFPVGIRGTLVASFDDRSLHLTDTVRGADRVVRGARIVDSYEGAFSPDASLLAVTATKRRIAVIDVASGAVALVPGARTDEFYASLTWASSGWLFWNAGGGALAAWRPGEPVRRLGAKTSPFVDMTSD
jgi:hypothetical protein